MLCKTLTCDGVYHHMLYNMISTCVYNNCANFLVYYLVYDEYITMLANAIANFFLLVVTDLMITNRSEKNHEDVIMADLFWPMWFNYDHFIR